MANLSPKQIEVLKFPYYDCFDGIICDGSVRSGKTSVISIAYILWAMNNFNDCNFIIAGNTVTTCYRNVIDPLLKVKYLVQQGFSLSYRKTDALLTVKRASVVNYFHIFGGKDEASYKKVQGLTAAGAFFDEVVLMPKSFVNQAMARCSINGALYWFSCNPDDPNHWFYQEVILLAKKKHYYYLHFTMDDNPGLTQKTKERYRNMYQGVFFKRNILGMWCKAEGVIYPMFANNPEEYCIDVPIQNIKDRLMIVNTGVDFGNNLSAHGFVSIGITDNFKYVVVLKSKRVAKSLTPVELDAELDEFATSVLSEFGGPFQVRCDSAETTLINGFKDYVENTPHLYGFVEIRKALKREIIDRIRITDRLISQHRLWILHNASHDNSEIINALSNCVWDEKHPGERLDEVGPRNPVDILDAFEYALEEYTNPLMEAAYANNFLENEFEEEQQNG